MDGEWQDWKARPYLRQQDHQRLPATCQATTEPVSLGLVTTNKNTALGWVHWNIIEMSMTHTADIFQVETAETGRQIDDTVMDSLSCSLRFGPPFQRSPGITSKNVKTGYVIKAIKLHIQTICMLNMHL